MLETSESDTILNSNFSDGTKDNESTWSSETDSLCVTVLTPGPSRIQFDLMALVLSSSLRSHFQPALGDCVWRIWYPVVAESIIVFAETIEVKWMHTALCVLPLTPLWEQWSISACALLFLLVSTCTFKSSQRCFTCLLNFSQILTRPVHPHPSIVDE